MIEARVVLGLGDDEIDYGKFKFIAPPQVGQNLLLPLEEDLIPLRVAEVCHYSVRSDQADPPAVIIRAEKQ